MRVSVENSTYTRVMRSSKANSAPTITDVAQLLRISRSTVSRAFTRPELLSVETVKSVHAAATKLGYRPSLVARALSTGRHGNIAIVVPDIANPFIPPLLRAAQAAADGAGFSLFLGDSDEDGVRESVLLEKLLLQADGAVIVGSRMPNDKIQEFAKRYPVVLVNNDSSGIPRVLIDTAAGIDAAVTHLVELGHKRLVYVCGPASSWSDQQRRSAAKRAAKRLKITLEQIAAPRPTFDAGKAVTAAVLKTRATGAITFDDFVAYGLLAGLAERSVVVPRDFSVIGCDDSLGGPAHLALTTISSRCTDAGRIAVRMLLATLQAGNKMDRRCVLDTQLVVRETTAKRPASTRHVE
jgi:DNA-binding LacI/PurR family transcriptional regulator